MKNMEIKICKVNEISIKSSFKQKCLYGSLKRFKLFNLSDLRWQGVPHSRSGHTKRTISKCGFSCEGYPQDQMSISGPGVLLRFADVN